MKELTEIDGIGLCSECYEDHTSVCPICGEIHINYNLHKINLADSHNELHYYNDFYVCDNCYNQAKNEGLKENPYFTYLYSPNVSSSNSISIEFEGIFTCVSFPQRLNAFSPTKLSTGEKLNTVNAVSSNAL